MSERRGLPETRRFEILREIGSGGSGRVYLARDRYTGAGPLALKILTAGGPSAEAFQALEEEFLPLRELSHPGLVRVFERGVIPETGEPFYTSEFLEGTDFVTAARGLHVDRLIELAVQILRTLEYIHRRGYVHCDLKPGNVLVTREGEAKILDFGLTAREGDVREEGRIRGTLPYVAPETLRGRPVDRRADLFSLGVVLYQALTGELPPRGEDLLPVFEEEALLSLPVPFDSLLHRLLQADPLERPLSAAKVLELLGSFTGREIPVETEESLRAHLESGRFVGREVELGTLMAELRSTVLGSQPCARRLLVVRGEPGSGKRRLLLEFKDRCQREGVDYFSATCFEGQETAYGPFEPVLRALIARVGPGSPRAERAKPALSRVLTELTDAAGERLPPRLSGLQNRLRWLDEIVEFLRDVAQGGQGYVLAIESIHRASLEMVELLGYVARTLCLTGETCPPILIVVSMRDVEEVPRELRDLLTDLAAESLLLPIDLKRFGELEVKEFVAAMVGIDDPPKRLVTTLFEKTGGNVFFLEQLIKALVEEGTIYYRNDRWRVGDLSRLRVPDSVAQVVARRLEDLPPRAHVLLEVVAAYGEPAPKAVLGKVLPGSEKLLGPLVRRQILSESEDGRSLGFRHNLVAQLVLERANPRKLRGIHGELARVLKSLQGSGIRPEKVAHHASLGDDRRRALRYALQAARRLGADGKFDQAAIFYMRALSRLERDDPRRPELLDALGDAHSGAGRLELAAAAYRKASEEGLDQKDLAAVHRKLAEVLERSGAYGEALEHVTAGLDLVDPENAGTRIPLLRLLGAIHKQRGEYPEAIECIREGLRLGRGKPTEEAASLLSLLGNVYMLMGEHRKALNFQLRSLRFSQSLEFDAGAASALHNLGTLMSAWGNSRRALRYFSESLRITERLMNLPAVALTYNNIGNIHSEAGDFERSEYYHRRSLAIRRRIGDPFGIAMSFGNIGSMHRLRGQWGLAVAYYERAVRHFLRIGNEYGAALFRTHFADLLLLVGAYDRAGELLGLAEQTARSLNFKRIEGRADRLQSRLARHRGDFAEARRWLTRALETDRALAYRDGVVESLIELALVHRARGRRGHALRAIGRALSESRAARSEALSAECRLLRGLLGSGAGGEPGERASKDVDAFVKFAEISRRPEAMIRGLEVRARQRLRAGDEKGAAEDAGEAIRLVGEIASGLPDDLSEVYREDRRRARLRALIEKVLAKLESAGGNLDAARLIAESEKMKPENLHRMLEINKRLNSETDLEALLEFIMDSAVEFTGAERGFLILVDDKRIAFQVARNFKRKEVEEPELKISQSIVRQVMLSGEPILTDNATEDERFSKYRSVDNLKLTSIISVPFESRGQRLGALYLDNQAKKGVFSEEDVETLKALSDQAAIAIQNLQNRQKLRRRIEAQHDELTRVKKALDERPFKYDYDEIIGRSSRMKEVFLLLDKIIETEVPVLIQGESGTGKELVARAIHFKGPRKDRPFVTVNCGAVPDNLLESEFFGYVRGAFTGAVSDKTGLFEQAHTGTLFLDEIGDMDFEMQKKLLRVLQQGEVRPVGGKKTVQVDVRIVCATNKDLRQRMMERKFREDLYYRINVIAVTLPPLRDRREDTALLVTFFAGKTAEEMGLPLKEIDQEARALLTAYSWPGNVRELENEVKKAMALSDEVITADDLSPHIQGERADREPSLTSSKGTLKETMEATEKSIIVRALEETGGNQTRAAKVLGISRVWLRKKMEKYGLLD